MCIAAPCRIIEITECGMALVDLNGIRQEISILMVPQVKAGDYVIAYLGSALSIIDKNEAEETMRLFRELAELEMPGGN